MFDFLNNLLTTRELALLVWVTILLSALVINSPKSSVFRLLKTFFAKPLLLILVLMILCTVLVLLTCYYSGLWYKSIIKDAIFCFVASYIMLISKVTEIRNNDFFKGILKQYIRWVILLEFIVAMYSFSFVAELIITPIVILSTLLSSYININKDKIDDHRVLLTFLTNIMALIGLCFIGYSIYRSILDFHTIFHIDTLKEFTVPLIISLCLLIYIYAIAVYLNYETLFLRINKIVKDEQKKIVLKKECLKFAKINIEKIVYLTKNLNKVDIFRNADMSEYIATVIAKPINKKN